MVVVCPNCELRHTLDSDLVPVDRAAIISCRGCGERFPLREARRIGVMSGKGGVGKTTVAVTLASGLALLGQRVLLVDTDNQGQASYMLGVSPRAGLFEILSGSLPATEAPHKVRENLWLLDAGLSLGGVSRLIDRRQARGELALEDALAPLAPRFDYIIADTATGWSSMSVAVLFYVHTCIVPVTPDVLAIQGLIRFMENFSSVQAYRNGLAVSHVLPVHMSKPTRSAKQNLEKLAEVYGHLLAVPIRYSERAPEAPSYGMTLFEYCGREAVADDFRDLVRDVAQLAMV